jgi:hypothetical protein
MFKSFLLAAALLVAPVAQAANGFDTGTPNGLGSTLVVDGSNWIAGQISFSNAMTITGINAWLSDSNGTGGTFTVALYSNAANLPSTLLQSATATFSTGSGSTGWNGASGLSWSVGPGTYWAAVEVQGGGILPTDPPADTFAGLAPTNAPNPLARYAFNDGSGYRLLSNAAPGMQVAAVPEPEVYAMMLAGLMLIGFKARRRKA